jgi:predicted MFS family arabinose efflux permease
MNSTADLVTRPAVATRRHLSPAAAFFLLASITVSFLAGSSAPTPLYPTYMAQWGISALTITIIFGIYAIAVLVALLVAGRLSDHLGRRPVLIVATLVQAVCMGIFAFADGVSLLIVGRILQGLAAGAALSAIGAGMLDIDKTKGAIANAVTPPFGTASGAVVAGVLVQYLPAPTVLVYIVFAAVFLIQTLLLLQMKETISPLPGVAQSLIPRIVLPAATREPLLLAIPVLVAVWALGGFYASLAPLLVKTMVGSQSPLLGGLVVFVLAAVAGVSVLTLRHQSPVRMLTIGAGSLLIGVAVALAALPSNAVGLFFVGTAIAGIGFGSGFQGSVRSVVAHAAPHERAGVLSIVFIVSYLAMGLPAVAAGAMIARHVDILQTSMLFGGAVIALAVAALGSSALRSMTRRPRAF